MSKSTSLLVAFAILILSGCATTGVDIDASRKELEKLNVLQVDASPEVELNSERFGRLESIVDSAGTAHLVGIDSKAQIHHIIVDSTGVSHDEVIGTLPKTVDNNKASFDIIEYPAGTIRIAVGETEYVRLISGGEWSRTGGNHCRQYLIHASTLFCAFVASGEEVGTAPRTDVNIGVILILPVAWPTTVRPGKLILAEWVDSSWVERTVIDPTTDWSADESDFEMGVDQHDMIHVVFGVRRGGIGCFMGGGYYSFGGGCSNLTEPEMRYARFALPANGLHGGAQGLARNSKH